MPTRHVMRLPALLATAATMVLSAVLATAAFAQPGDAPQRAEVKRTVFNQSALRPGDKAMLAVEVEVKKGFHAQSHNPTGEFAIKFDLALDKNDAVTFGEPVYPKGVDEDYP